MYTIICLVYLFYLPHCESESKHCSRPNEYRDCIYKCSPERTCRNKDITPNCLYRGNCTWKCVCVPGFYTNSIGDCITGEQCARCPGLNEYFACGSPCDNECSTLHERNQTHCPIVNKKCTNQCYCDEGYARNKYGECIPFAKCPAKNMVQQDPQKCSPNEHRDCIYQCSPERTCKNRDAEFDCLYRTNCKWKCVCRPGLYRNSIGECVPEEQCDPMRCYRANEVLDCVFPCPPEKTCRNREVMFNCLDVIQPCRPQCVCKPGFYRNSNGDCVTGEQCAKCPGKHEFFSCGSACDTECATLNQICPIINIKCNEKCYCEKGYARDEHRQCIPITECPPKP